MLGYFFVAILSIAQWSPSTSPRYSLNVALCKGNVICSESENIVYVVKKSVTLSYQESFSILAEGRVVSLHTTFSDNTTKTYSLCLPISSNNLYTLRLMDS